MSIGLYTTVEITPSKDKQYHLISEDQDFEVSGSFAHVTSYAPLALLGSLIKALWPSEGVPLCIRSHASSPKGAGLGGSSTLCVALSGALNRLSHRLYKHTLLTPEQLVQLTCNAEAKILKIPTGNQDHWAAVKGGVNLIEYPLTGPRVTSVQSKFAKLLQDRLIVCYSGQSRSSATNNWIIYRNLIDQDAKTFELLNLIAQQAASCKKSIELESWEDFLENSKKEWSFRKALWKDIETSQTKALDAAAAEAGASFTRVCGAGGGGAMAIFVEPAAKDSVAKALKHAKGIVLDTQIASPGLNVVENEI